MCDLKFNIWVHRDKRTYYYSNGAIISLTKGRQVRYPGTFHIGFILDNEKKVNEIYQRLKENGFDVNPPQRLHAWTFYVKAPGGFKVEVLCRSKRVEENMGS
ncbi:VOC family protein [Bacillus sp. Sa1BUA2]|uniref:VOC family protein n=1 Tax=Bacillus norwichensis TaxID=2762217 RepID=A0ABR8VJT2_9BACI|nr:VOC family protein [Bacillus norwichensis]